MEGRQPRAVDEASGKFHRALNIVLTFEQAPRMNTSHPSCAFNFPLLAIRKDAFLMRARADLRISPGGFSATLERDVSRR